MKPWYLADKLSGGYYLGTQKIPKAGGIYEALRSNQLFIAENNGF